MPADRSAHDQHVGQKDGRGLARRGNRVPSRQHFRAFCPMLGASENDVARPHRRPLHRQRL